MTKAPVEGASPPRALLLGASGRYPFKGHLRFLVDAGAARLHGAGSLAIGAAPGDAFRAARAVEIALSQVRGSTRHAMLREAWSALASLDPSSLGPSGGTDLALLLLGEDESGLAVAGTGLSCLYALDGPQGVALLPGAHPIFALSGIPSSPPRCLEPASAPAIMVGEARTGAGERLVQGSWLAACGVRGGAHG